VSFIDKEIGSVSYIVHSNSEAIIIDPLRIVDEYVEYLKKNNLKLKYILLTHLHADFVAGHRELKEIFNAEILPFREAEYKLGEYRLKIISTPGHTEESVSCLVDERFLFTGDFLLVGNIGRVDFIKNGAELAYESAKKIKSLDDDIVVLAGHVKGSFCSGGLSAEFISSIGIEKKKNRVFSIDNKDEFIKAISKRYDKPSFASRLPQINKNPKLIKDLGEVERVDYIVDIREIEDFEKAHIKGSINIPQKANIPFILGYLVDIDKKVGIIGYEDSNFEEVRKRLLKVGFNKVKILGSVENFDTEPFIREKKKIIDLDKIRLSEIKKYRGFGFKCKNGYRAIAVESFLRSSNENNS